MHITCQVLCESCSEVDSLLLADVPLVLGVDPKTPVLSHPLIFPAHPSALVVSPRNLCRSIDVVQYHPSHPNSSHL